MAGTHGADSGLFLQFALGVPVGDARRNAHPTAPGALGPFGGLEWTLLLLQMVPHWQVLVALFSFPAAGLHITQIIGQIQLIFSLVWRSGLWLFRWRHLSHWWQMPGALMAVNTEAALPRYPDEPGVRAGW